MVVYLDAAGETNVLESKPISETFLSLHLLQERQATVTRCRYSCADSRSVRKNLRMGIRVSEVEGQVLAVAAMYLWSLGWDEEGA